MFDTPVLPRLDTVLAEVKSGDLMIPEFQRPFVWDDARRLNLLDSIVEGMPIGSLLVWRTNKRDLRTYDSLGGVLLDTARKRGEKVNYLIDGHQRISTLFGALYSGARNYKDPQESTRWPLYYELGGRKRPAFRVPPRRGPVPPNWLPLAILLDGDKLFEFTQRLREKNERVLAKEAERLANIFRDYIIPIVPLVTEELNVVTDAFVRINSQGKAMSEAHMLRALTHLGAADTDTHFRRVKETLEPLGWGDIDDQVIVNVLKAQLQLDIYAADVRGVYEKLKRDPKPLEELDSILTEAIDFLAKVGVCGPTALPYTYQLVTLAACAAWSPGILRAPASQSYLRDWFWVSTYTELFSGITGSRIRDVMRQVFASLEDPQQRIDGLASGDSEPVKSLTHVRGSTGRAKAFLLFLAQLPANANARSRRQERLAASDRAAPSLLPITGSSDPGNRVIADPEELRWIREAIRGQTVSDEMADEFFLPKDAIAELPNHKKFIERRREELAAREAAFLEEYGLLLDET